MEIAITGAAGYIHVATVMELRLTPKLHILHTDVEMKLTCGLTICGVFMLVCGLFILFFTIIIVTIMMVTSSSSSTHLDTPIAMYAEDTVVLKAVVRYM